MSLRVDTTLNTDLVNSWYLRFNRHYIQTVNKREGM